MRLLCCVWRIRTTTLCRDPPSGFCQRWFAGCYSLDVTRPVSLFIAQACYGRTGFFFPHQFVMPDGRSLFVAHIEHAPVNFSTSGAMWV